MEGFFPSVAGNDTDMAASGQPAPGRPAPRSRDSFFLLARLTLQGDDTPREVRVRNLSAGGLMAEHDGRVAIGDPVRVELRGVGEVSGRIAWSAEGRIGIALNQPIDPNKARKPVTTRPATR